MLKIRKRTFSGSTSTEVSVREKDNRVTARVAAEEGIVLLKNEGILPLCMDKTVGLFGSGSCCTVKGGTGSGDVCARETISVYQGMLKEGFRISSLSWIEDYEKRYTEQRLAWRDEILSATEGNMEAFFDCYSSRIFRAPAGRAIDQTDLSGADTAVYVISRTAGENEDRLPEAGDYYLSEAEKEDLKILSDLCTSLIVIINSGAQMDMNDILALDKVRAVLYICQPGMEGGNAVAGVLSGRVTPSGKLTDTWAVHYSDFPNAESFGRLKGENPEEIYSEGIYVGYRYFDSFDVTPLYPFGYGLSYTEFEIDPVNVECTEYGVTAEVSVKNTGMKYSGKEVVQLYLSAPARPGRELKKLAAYKKTELLKPGEKEVLRLKIDPKEFAWYSEEESAWKIDAGKYIVLVGNSSRHLKAAGTITVHDSCVYEKDSPICPLRRELEEWKADGQTAEKIRKQWLEEISGCGRPDIDYVPKAQKFSEISLKNAALAEEIASKLTQEQLTMMSLGEISRGQENALGAAGIMVPGAAGETSGCLESEYSVPSVSMADGPAGLRLMREYQADTQRGEVYTMGILGALENGLFLVEKEKDEHPAAVTYHQYCTAFPVGTMLAQTWNDKIQEQVGSAVGIELQEMGISWWLAPGMNIHRNPLCGRNFEYFSEDPVVAGYTAAAVTRGVQKIPGVGTTIKHFACNNREHNRMASDSILRERTLREIYLRGFEIAVRTSQPMAVMSSYNLVNGIHTASNYDLLTTVLRREWGFAGIIMTDWTTTSPVGGTIAWEVMAAGGNLIMPGAASDIDSIREALKDGKLSVDVLRERIRELIVLILQTNACEDSVSYGSYSE